MKKEASIIEVKGSAVEFLGTWESLNNPASKPLEFEGFRNRAILNSFVLTPMQWIDATSAIGLVSRAGRYGGTIMHKSPSPGCASSWPIADGSYLKDNLHPCP